VLDTNIVLDVLVFDDAAAQPLRDALAAGTLRWLTTAAMRDELQRVLGYPQILPRLAHRALSAADVLRRFDSLARRVEPPGKAPVSCKDQDDQKFVDLAVAHRAVLLSKDGAVLALRKRLAVLGVPVATAWPDTRM